MADSEREDRRRRGAAVQREMSRLRSTDEPDDKDAAEETGETGDRDLVDAVDEALRREREVQDDDPPS